MTIIEKLLEIVLPKYHKQILNTKLPILKTNAGYPCMIKKNFVRCPDCKTEVNRGPRRSFYKMSRTLKEDVPVADQGPHINFVHSTSKIVVWRSHCKDCHRYYDSVTGKYSANSMLVGPISKSNL